MYWNSSTHVDQQLWHSCRFMRLIVPSRFLSSSQRYLWLIIDTVFVMSMTDYWHHVSLHAVAGQGTDEVFFYLHSFTSPEWVFVLFAGWGQLWIPLPGRGGPKLLSHLLQQAQSVVGQILTPYPKGGDCCGIRLSVFDRFRYYPIHPDWFAPKAVGVAQCAFPPWAWHCHCLCNQVNWFPLGQFWFWVIILT